VSFGEEVAAAASGWDECPVEAACTLAERLTASTRTNRAAMRVAATGLMLDISILPGAVAPGVSA
jgi:hypothetical protein